MKLMHKVHCSGLQVLENDYVRHHATVVELAIVGTVDLFTKGKVANP